MHCVILAFCRVAFIGLCFGTTPLVYTAGRYKDQPNRLLTSYKLTTEEINFTSVSSVQEKQSCFIVDNNRSCIFFSVWPCDIYDGTIITLGLHQPNLWPSSKWTGSYRVFWVSLTSLFASSTFSYLLFPFPFLILLNFLKWQSN